MMFSKKSVCEIVSGVDETLAQLIATIGFTILIARRSARHSINVVRLVEEASVTVFEPFHAR